MHSSHVVIDSNRFRTEGGCDEGHKQYSGHFSLGFSFTFGRGDKHQEHRQHTKNAHGNHTYAIDSIYAAMYSIYFLIVL